GIAAGIDSDAHAMWTYREAVDMDWDLKHSRSIVNIPPEPIDDLIFIVVDEELGMVGWTPNREPDFQRYKTYISEDKNFTISDEPGGPLYNESSNQLMNREVYNDQNDKNIDIEPDTTYYTKVVIEDQEGLTSVSNEVMFRTRPVNKAPVFVKEIPTLYMLEDEASEGALNLTHWREMGWIWDDVYNGYPALAYFVESEAEEPNVSANIRKVGIDPVVHFLDFFPLSTKQNWFGSEVFRIGVQDSGKDGGIGTPDDVIGYSNWFTLQVNSTNDVPIWLSFYDLNSDVNRPLQSTATELHLKIKESGALEDMEYRFSLKANDVDNDFLEYSASDDRVKIKVDGQDPQHKSIFTITPDNEDVPELNMTVTVSDRKGGERNITLYIPIENINGAPIFTDVDGEAILPTGGSVDFSIKEKGENSSVTFQIKAWDEDFGDVLTLKSMSSKPEIDKLGPRTWNVTVTAEEEDAISGSISFLLELLDRQKTDLSTLMVNIEVLNVPDPPEWVLNSGKVKVFFTYDENDENEWVNSKIEAEWDEPVEFEAYATDRDGDELTYTWIFINENSGEEFSADGKEITIRFYPSSGNLSNAKREKFLISLMVSDGNPLSEDISYYRELWLWPDDDNDNDGMPDKREIFFFGDLSQDPDDNWDLDGYTNVEEIGFGIPQFDPEKKVPYSMDRNQMDPTNKDVFPGQYTITGDDDDSQEEKGLPVFTIVIITIVALFLIAIAGGIVVVLRIQKKKDIEEDEDIEKRVKAMDERQKTLQGLYGVQKAGDIIGPDQSTLDDLTLDLGGQLYHEEGSGSLIKRTDEDEGEKKEVKSGPNWESGAGPVFESGAPGLEFGQSLEINDIDSDELSGKDIDEAALADTMGDLMDAADDFDEEALKDAGGNVMIGAVPMEEQIKQMQGGLRTQAGPRNPPPGQAPPPMQVPPGQAPPQMQAAPRQKGLPPAKPLKKPEEL
ncbi:MAG: hypothetical protein U9R75_01455, partial [Candidatus Thermoplasmatota archaeon]|nr:hypothetical protein [Candidatus Thermoplasmatota archaeon]